MLSIQNVTKKYGKNIAVEDVSIEIKDGESVAILGANGSGKTTLVEIIAGVLKPTSGHVKKDDKNIASNDIGIQFQEGAWPRGINSKSIIEFYVGKSALKTSQIKEYIDVFEIEDFLLKDLNDLSGGQKQRFNALLSIINNPKILILDELITGLDLKMQIKLISFFNEVRKKEKITFLVVSHIPEEIEAICDRVVLLEKGKIILDEKLDVLLNKYGSIRKMMTRYFEGTLKNV